MLVIQHRSNDISKACLSEYAEIDVQINHKGKPIVRHNPYGDYVRLDMFINLMKYDKVFVDIKQNLDVKDLKKIVEECGDKLIGLFDVPFPSVYYASHWRWPIYHRVSEWESGYPIYGPSKYWLDPLENYHVEKYQILYDGIQNRSQGFDQIIVACPSLHFEPIDSSIKIWEWMKDKKSIQGIVTKHVAKCREILDENR